MLKTIITADMLGGVLNEVVGVLPVAIPVLITFIALRKGISFIQSILHSAWCLTLKSYKRKRGVIFYGNCKHRCVKHCYYK